MLKKILMIVLVFVSAHVTAQSMTSSNSLCHAQIITVLSIDGGGVKGIIPATYLDQLEQATHQKSAKLFDLLVGVSTGSIIVSLLTTPDQNNQPKYSAKNLLHIYKQGAPIIFSASLYHKIKTLGGLIGPKYSSAGINQLANQYYQNIEIGDLTNPLVVFGYDMRTKSIVPFCNWDGCKRAEKTDKIGDIIVGTTAIMSYFASKTIYNNKHQAVYQLNDTSFIMNNPAAISYMYARNLCPNAKHYLILSLGTGRYSALINTPKEWGIIQWLSTIVATTIEGDTTMANLTISKIAKLVNKDTSKQSPEILFVRINPKLDSSDSDPVNASRKNIEKLQSVAMADYAARHYLMSCLAKILVKKSFQGVDSNCINELESESNDFFNDYNAWPYIPLLSQKRENNHPIGMRF